MANTSDVSTSTLNVVGVSTLGGNLNMGDNVKLLLGDAGASDVEIYHDSVDTYINNSTGTLYLRGDTISLNAKSTTDKYFDATNGGASNLYYDNSKKFETTTSGATITGAGICTSLSVGPGIVQEDFHNYGTALTGTYNHDVVTHGMVLDSTVAASASFVINLRGDGSTTFKI